MYVVCGIEYCAERRKTLLQEPLPSTSLKS